MIRGSENYLDNIKINLHKVVCSEFNITEDELKGKLRKRSFVDARHICFQFLKSETKLSLSQIGVIYNRNHATVLHGIENSNNMNSTDFIYKERYNRVYADALETINVIQEHIDSLIKPKVIEFSKFKPVAMIQKFLFNRRMKKQRLIHDLFGFFQREFHFSPSDEQLVEIIKIIER